MRDRSEELKKRLLEAFSEEAEIHLLAINEELEALRSAQPGIHQADREETLFRAMHTLKGASRSVGLDDVERYCHDCEAVLREITLGQRPMLPQTIKDLQDAADRIADLIARSAMVPPRPDPATVAPPRQAADASIRPAAPSGRVDNLPRPAAPAATPHPPPSAQASTGAAMPPAPQPRVPETAAKPAPRSATAADTGSADPRLASLRVRVSDLDRLTILAEDLILPRLAARSRAETMVSIASQVDVAVEAIAQIRRQRGSGPGEDDGLGDIAASLSQIRRTLRDLGRGMERDSRTLNLAVDGIQEEVRRLRMMPAATALEAFPRMVRDLARATGKEVEWQIIGGDMLIDRKVLDLVKDPLIHMVRNAVDHGIEPPEEREAAHKPRAGHIMLTFAPGDAGRVVVTLEDDGRGFSPKALREAAVRSRAMTQQQAEALDDTEVLELAFRPGVSTSPVITGISGHGRGLAIVQETVERIDGDLKLTSIPSQGMRLTIELPVSIATYRGLMLKAKGQTFLLPQEAVERVIRIPRDSLPAALARGMWSHGGESHPLGNLGALLGLRHGAAEEESRRYVPAVVLHSGDRRAIFIVDKVMGESEAVLKDLRPPLERVRNVLSMGLLGSGALVPVLRPSDLVISVKAMPAAQQAEIEAARMRVPRILVVDDSITTRTMERNLFEAAGYQVTTAADGMDAWEMLQTQTFDLVVSDIDMPRMDGFELTTQIRASEDLGAIPVVLVTAMESREDKERGIRIGANAYVMKSKFDDSNLIEIVRRLT
ncbi:MAG: response regulator [Rhodospirillaceae bacterium]|nr:response regulator [Rhodospirillaceae bacterium]